MPPCPWNEHACTYAAEEGHLHVLQWLRLENNPPCPWSKHTCRFAAAGHTDVLNWLRLENDAPCPRDDSTCEDWDCLAPLNYIV